MIYSALNLAQPNAALSNLKIASLLILGGDFLTFDFVTITHHILHNLTKDSKCDIVKRIQQLNVFLLTDVFDMCKAHIETKDGLF